MREAPLGFWKKFILSLLMVESEVTSFVTLEATKALHMQKWIINLNWSVSFYPSSVPYHLKKSAIDNGRVFGGE